MTIAKIKKVELKESNAGNEGIRLNCVLLDRYSAKNESGKEIQGVVPNRLLVTADEVNSGDLVSARDVSVSFWFTEKTTAPAKYKVLDKVNIILEALGAAEIPNTTELKDIDVTDIYTTIRAGLKNKDITLELIQRIDKNKPTGSNDNGVWINYSYDIKGVQETKGEFDILAKGFELQEGDYGDYFIDPNAEWDDDNEEVPAKKPVAEKPKATEGEVVETASSKSSEEAPF